MLSVIMPVYNSEKYLNKAIESVLNQSYTDLELILIDDGSTDGSRGICYEYKNTDPRIVFLESPHKGVAHARNIGLENARGQYISFVDSDDVIHPQAFELAFMHPLSEHQLIAFPVQKFADNNELTFAAINKNTISTYESTSSFNGLIKLLLDPGKSIDFFLWNKIYPASVIGELRFNEDYRMCEDLLFNLNVLSNIDSIMIISEALYFYRNSENGITHTPDPNVYHDCVRAYKVFLDTYTDQLDTNAMTEVVDRYISFNVSLAEIMMISRKYNRSFYQDIRTSLSKYKKYIPKLRPALKIKGRLLMVSYKLFQIEYWLELQVRRILRREQWAIS